LSIFVTNWQYTVIT